MGPERRSLLEAMCSEDLESAESRCCYDDCEVHQAVQVARSFRSTICYFLLSVGPSTWAAPEGLPPRFWLLLKIRLWTAVFGIITYAVMVHHGLAFLWDPLYVMQLLSAMNMLASCREVQLFRAPWPLATLGVIMEHPYEGDLWRAWCADMVRNFTWDGDNEVWGLLNRKQVESVNASCAPVIEEDTE